MAENEIELETPGLWEEVLLPTEERTRRFGQVFSLAKIPRECLKPDRFAQRVGYATVDVAVNVALRVARATNDGREYVVAFEPLKQNDDSDGSLVISQTATVRLANFEDAQVGEFVWEHAHWSLTPIPHNVPLGTILEGYRHVGDRRIVPAGRMGLGDLRVIESPRFRRVPEGWERVR